MATSSGDSAAAKQKETSSLTAASPSSKPLTQEQIVAGFQELRNQQRAIISKVAEIDGERKEHELVIEALKEVDSSRKCFRMVGGVLVERTVATVLPALTSNYDQLGKLMETLSRQLEAKGKDLNEYRQKYNIRMKGEDEGVRGATANPTDTAGKGSGVLVGKS